LKDIRMRRHSRTHRLPILALALIAQAAALPALAALGEDATSVENDRLQMKGEVRVLPAAGYAVHEIRTPSGTVVREYVAPSGKVFGVAWRGPTMPDLRQTLGSHFEELVAAAGSPHGGHHNLVVEKPDLVLHSGGHMRAFAGHAFVPALLPAGVSADVIQ
jgi:hypothetical protein